MGEIRPDGARLDVRHVHDELRKALFGGGLLCLSGSPCAELLLSIRHIRRVVLIKRATGRIASGDLAMRLPVAGRDELDMLALLVNRLMGEVKGACDGIAHDLRTRPRHDAARRTSFRRRARWRARGGRCVARVFICTPAYFGDRRDRSSDDPLCLARPEKDDIGASTVNLVVSRLRRKLERQAIEVRIEAISRYGHQLTLPALD